MKAGLLSATLTIPESLPVAYFGTLLTRGATQRRRLCCFWGHRPAIQKKLKGRLHGPSWAQQQALSPEPQDECPLKSPCPPCQEPERAPLTEATIAVAIATPHVT